MASLLLSNGKYLHTAYAVSNIAEEFTNDDWSLSSQEGFGYIGQYIDDSAVDSSDPTDYVWTEFLDEDVDDLDDEGDMPMADFQSQIDALQDQIEVLQGDAENLQSSIEVNASNVADSAQLASEAADIANATGQYFWHDANGAHVSTEENNPEGERNSIWNSLGMLFRKGATNLLAVLAGGASGTDPKGIAVYDGQGNSESNIVSQFTSEGVTIGRAVDGEQQIIISDNVIEFLTWVTYNSELTSSAILQIGTQATVAPSLHNIAPYYSLGYRNSRNGKGNFSIATGYNAEASGNYSFSGGYNSTASGYSSIAYGRNTSAIDSLSQAYGEETIATKRAQVVLGSYNIEDTSTTTTHPSNTSSYGKNAIIIGNGSESTGGEITRSNALTVDWNGDVNSSGKITATNLTGSQTADYTGSYKMGNCTILTGSVTINVTTANTNTDKTVTFGPTFKHTPCIQCTMLNIGGSYYQRVTAAGPSTTGFTARIRAGGTPGNVIVNWVAIGELA